MSNDYNGFKGLNGWVDNTSAYCTWNVCLWVDNHEGTYKSRLNSKPRFGWCSRTAEEFARKTFGERGTADMREPGYSLDAVNWLEVAEHWNEE